MKKKYLLSSMILLVFLILFTAPSLALIPGDFGSTGGGSPDGCVDSEDLEIFTMAYGSTSSDSNWNSTCDIAGPDGTLTPDGVINFEDLMIFAMHYGECDEDTSQSLITLSDSAIFDGKTVINGGKHTITVSFPAPIRVFITNYSVQAANIPRNFLGIPSNAVEVFMSTSDGKTYTGTADFGDGDCDVEWIYVLTGDSCCPVIYSMTVKVDIKPPYVDLKAIVGEEENCGTECEPAPGKRVIITSDAYVENEPPLCTPLCCGDDCTELAEWTIAVYDVLPPPFMDECGECVLDPCVSPIKVCTGTGCPVECDVFGCIPYTDTDELFDWETKESSNLGLYYVILEANDVVGNTYKGLGILFVVVIDETYVAILIDIELDENCQFDFEEIVQADIERYWVDYYIIMGPCTY